MSENNGEITLELRRDNLLREKNRMNAMLLKIEGALEIVNALIEDRDKEPEPEPQPEE